MCARVRIQCLYMLAPRVCVYVLCACAYKSVHGLYERVHAYIYTHSTAILLHVCTHVYARVCMCDLISI